MFESFRLVVLKPDGSDGIIFIPSKPFDVGCSLQCDVRFPDDAIKRKHFSVYATGSGKVKEISILIEPAAPLFAFVVAILWKQIKIKNFSAEHPVVVNNEAVEVKRALKSGDVIDLLGHKMRWETKADAKREAKRKLNQAHCIKLEFTLKCVFVGMTELMSRSERKAKKSRCMKTKNRITIHK